MPVFYCWYIVGVLLLWVAIFINGYDIEIAAIGMAHGALQTVLCLNPDASVYAGTFDMVNRDVKGKVFAGVYGYLFDE